MEKKETQQDDAYCFACGKENPCGLRLQFSVEGERYIARHTVPAEYQSYSGIVHGGIVSTMLDEAMGGYLYAKGYKAVTARLNIRYREATPIGKPLKIAGWITAQRGKFIDMAAAVSLEDGTVTAEGTAKMAVVEE